ncbi:hypothetical protein QYF50_00935 [Paenibacillus vini]|uniref:hypothetical protein n=1 Tax=Paenibacillus vini TaxID=1476024 RepID=UPI0025B7147A|nr:hypothetical protein [Paenibacillus vini]MDN4066442.1 hypothetical protein [Paenibacillus vini]
MIDQYLKELEKITETFVSQLAEVNYEEVELFIERRQHLCDKLFSESNHVEGLNSIQKNLLTNILSADNLILPKMYELRNDASEWLERNNQIKRQKTAYLSSYTADSFFIDKKN